MKTPREVLAKALNDEILVGDYGADDGDYGADACLAALREAGYTIEKERPICVENRTGLIFGINIMEEPKQITIVIDRLLGDPDLLAASERTQ